MIGFDRRSGSHNVRSLAQVWPWRNDSTFPKTPLKCKCSTAWAKRSARAFVERGLRVRVYTPYGAMLPGMAYLRASALGKHVERIVPQSRFQRTRADRTTPTKSRGDWNHVGPKPLEKCPRRVENRRDSAVPQRAADRFLEGRKSRQNPRGLAFGPRIFRPRGAARDRR